MRMTKRWRGVVFTSPASWYKLSTSSCASWERQGKIVGNVSANKLFPHPGGPIINTLCSPAAATSSAYLAYSCPMICSKSRCVFEVDGHRKEADSSKITLVDLVNIAPLGLMFEQKHNRYAAGTEREMRGHMGHILVESQVFGSQNSW